MQIKKILDRVQNNLIKRALIGFLLGALIVIIIKNSFFILRNSRIVFIYMIFEKMINPYVECYFVAKFKDSDPPLREILCLGDLSSHTGADERNDPSTPSLP